MDNVLGDEPNVTNYTSTEPPPSLKAFADIYGTYHGFLSVIVCAFGITTNVFNVAVLTRKNMRTPTNVILTGLAIADILTMMSYVPFALHFYIFYSKEPSAARNTLGWSNFLLFHANFSITTHTVSIWCGVTLAIFRYIYIRYGRKQPNITDVTKALFAVVLVYIYAIILVVPNYLSLTIVPIQNDDGETLYYTISEIKELDSIALANFWMHALLVKLIPCFLLSVFGGLLVSSIHKVQVKGRQLKNGSSRSAAFRTRMREHSRTTRMLTVVIILFLVTEFPQGVLTLLSGVKEGFFLKYYEPLGDLMDIIALINNSINFILYCSMSKTFRQTFVTIFWNFGEKEVEHSECNGFISIKTQPGEATTGV